ncbi:sugar transferase [Bacillus sp. AK128]
MKRISDLCIAIILIAIFSPIILVTAFMIRIKVGTPILFKQLRPGLNEKPFYLYKFRTMTNETDKNGNVLSDQMRLTELGELLRRYSLDELPQLFNVIKGDMSLVGPRPLLMEYLSLYTKEQGKRHLVRPGITGWAQINGRNAISWDEKFKLDTWYVENQSFALDLNIILKTIIKVIKREGINQEGHVTIEKFKGSKEMSM